MRASGQAAVETTLTLPLALFMVLGTIQLFLLLQGRILAQYAVFKAVRAGAVNHGDCRVMQDAALAALLPAITRTDDRARLVKAFTERSNAHQYRFAAADAPHDRTIFWLDREPVTGITGSEEKDFDQPDAALNSEPTRLTAKLTFWFPMRVPFANQVMARMFLALWGIESYSAQNPLMMPAKAKWDDVHSPGPKGDLRSELEERVKAKQYELPLTVSSSMRMMTPVRTPFDAQCPRE